MTPHKMNFLLDEAVTETGLTDWGYGEFRENLALLVEELPQSPVTETGLAAFHKRVRRALRNRLRLIDDRKNYPTIAQQEVKRPLFVTGWPRSGSTFLHSLLAQDPSCRSAAEWEAGRPSPPPLAATYTTDERIALAADEMPKDPRYLKRHIQGVQLPVECGPTGFVYEFLTNGFDIRWRLPRSRQRMKGDISTAYHWHKRVLQHLQSHTTQSHWVLKSPEHIGHFPELFQTYPDARIVMTHRDPANIFPSLASLTAYLQEENLGPVDRKRTGRDILEFWGDQQQRAMSFRASAQHSGAFCDIDYHDLTADPMGVVSRIYDHHGMTLTTMAEAGMRDWLKTYGQEKYQETHGAHTYDCAEYGLNADELKERFSDYESMFINRG